MTGIFELFTDSQHHIRFRLLGGDGRVLAVSEAYPDKITAAAAISDVRECAGTGLIQDHAAAIPTTLGLSRPNRRTVPSARSDDTGTQMAPAGPPSNMDVRLQDLILVSKEISQFLAGRAALAATRLHRDGIEMSCAITVRQPKKPVALAGSERGALSMDELQNILGDGPCPTAMAEQKTVLAADLNDEQPWPRFVRSAVRHGFRSVLCVPLSAEGETRGALTLYARRPNAFSPEDINSAEAFAAQASRALRLVLNIAQLKDSQPERKRNPRTMTVPALPLVPGQRRQDPTRGSAD